MTFIFADSEDFDFPFQKQKKLFVFSENEEYNCQGKTHSGFSHAIKHSCEFFPEQINEFIVKGLDIIIKTDKVFLLHENGDIFPISANKILQQASGIVLNTFDMVNDKIMLDLPLLETEEKLKPLIFEISEQYNNLLTNYINYAYDIENITSLENLKEFIKDGKTLKFIAEFFLVDYIYYLNFSDSAIIACRKDNPKIINTFFRIDKKANDFKKIAKYLYKINIENKLLSEFILDFVDNNRKFFKHA